MSKASTAARTSKKAARTKGAAKPKAATKAASTPRAESKQSQLIAMLKQPDGATIVEIAKALHWELHTVRGAMSGAGQVRSSRASLAAWGSGAARMTAITSPILATATVRPSSR